MRRPVHRSRSELRWPSAAAAVLASLAVLVGGCLPGAEPALAPPTFRLLTDASRIVRLDPPGTFGDGALLVRVGLRAHNPNPLALRLDGLAGELWLGGVEAGALSFVGGIDLPARGEADLSIDVAVPVGRLAALVGVLGDALAGRPVAYRVDATVAVDVLGVPTRFPPITVARGEVRQPDLAPVAPRVRFDPASTGVSEARFDRITIGLGLVIDNPGPLGFVLRAPDARLRLGDREVATIGLPATAVPAAGSATLTQEVAVNPVALGVALATQLQTLAGGGAAAVDVVIEGVWELDLGILGRWTSPVGTLAAGRVD